MPAEPNKPLEGDNLEGTPTVGAPGVGSSPGSTRLSVEAITHLGPSVTFRNNWLLIGLMLLVAIVGLTCSLGFGLLAIGQIFPWQGFSFFRIFGALSWAVSAWAFWLLGAAVWRLTIAMSHNVARFDDQGVHFRLGPKKKTPEVYLAWGQIAAIRRQTVGSDRYFGVVAKDGQIIQFTMYTFFRAGTLAREIATRSGHSVETV
jgi:hypothetical protein